MIRKLYVNLRHWRNTSRT